ncbi:MAG: hypothetical protein HYX41_07210 [Bdellovibrio sp.]|nr:hypothetical protein [Bdellovibrio sp.]
MLGLTEESGKVAVGYVIKKQGTLQRQLSGDTTFKTLDLQNPIFNKDVLVTGPDSDALIQFSKGGGIHMGPSSMIRISFVSGLDLGGIKRHATVELVSGKVVNQTTDDSLVLKAQGKTFSMKANRTEGLEVKAGTPIKTIELSPVNAKGFELMPERDLLALSKKIEEVKAKEEAAPKPSPTPSRAPPPIPSARVIRILAGPVFDDSELRIRDSMIERILAMKWEMEPPDQPVQVAFWKLSEDKKSISKEPVVRETIRPRGTHGYYSWKGIPPGPYVWEIFDDKGMKLSQTTKSRGQLEISKRLDVIRPAPPLIGGRRTYSNQIDRSPIKDFNITLEWRAIEGIKDYEVQFSSSTDPNVPVQTEKVDTNRFTFSKEKILSGVKYYRIISRLENGYVIQSPLQRLTFQFLPPALVSPEQGAVLSKKSLASEEQNRIFFAWQKTNFTVGYEIEVANDEQFQSVLFKKITPQNYLTLPNPKAGQYYWRVRSLSKDISSQMSPAQRFTVNP